MPRCSKCGEEKPPEAFAFASKATGKLQSYCRACHAIARRAHYERTRATYIANERKRVRGHRELNRVLILEYLREHPCVDCGERDPVVLDFDHRDRSAKRLEVSRLANSKTWRQVRAEIEKCDVRCASCHRRRTAQQFGWRRTLWTSVEADGSLLVYAAQRQQTSATDATSLRTCCACGVAKPLAEFAVKNRRTGTRSTKCKACQRAYSRAHYQKNREKYLDKAKARNHSNRDAFAAFVIAYLRDHPCVDCGESDPTVLEFDHIDPTTKTATVNSLVRAQDHSALEKEIAKCEVRCANCHRRRTAQQFGWSSRVGEDGAAA